MKRLAAADEQLVKQKLMEANYADSTLKKYRAAVARFMEWVDDNKVPYDQLSTAAAVDEVACRYIAWLFYQTDGDKGKSVATTLLSALVAASPHLNGKLVFATKMARGWQRKKPAVPHPPISWELAVVMAYQMKRAGKPLYALATLLGFDCFLRNGEVVNLLRSDVADASDPRVATSYTGMALRLRDTKTGKNQWVTVLNPAVIKLLRERVKSLKSPMDRLFPFSSDQFRDVFRATADNLGLSRTYVVHSLRHGGATKAFLDGMPIAEIKKRGRWRADKSADHYIQSGPALLLQQSVPVSYSRLGQRLSTSLFEMFTASSTLSQKH
jgi:integrase